MLNKSRTCLGIAFFVLGLAQSAPAQLYSIRELPSPPNSHAMARKLNDAGNAAGRLGTTFATTTRAVLFRGGEVFEVLGALEGGDYSSAFGLNDRDEVVGASNTATTLQAFLWSRPRGFARLAPLPGDTASQAFAINAQGDAVGYSSGPTGVSAVRWDRQAGVQELGTPDGEASMAFAINNRGDVVGRSDSPSGPRAVLWSSRGTIIDVGVLPGDERSQALGINEPGTVVGFSSGRNGESAFVWTENAGMTRLGGLPGGDLSRALDINNQGQIVGFSTVTHTHDPAADRHAHRAVMWTAGVIQDLNTRIPAAAQVLLVEAQAINNRGQILAYGIPEPITDDLHELPGRLYLLTP
jgi:probable HAF family extracellular repeat protein